MRRLNKDSSFSASACRVRYGELTSGTARIPCDIDDNPDTRREELEVFRISRKAAREKEAAELETRETMEKKVKDSVKAKNAQKAEEIANKRAVKEQEKAQRAMNRAAQAQFRMQKAAENQKAKKERNALIMYASLPEKCDGSSKTNPAVDSSKATSSTVSQNKTAPSRSTEDPDAVDPRSYLSKKDLTTLCANRGLPVENRTNEQLVASLADADMEWSHDQLRKMCKAKGLSAGGTKVVMRYQLALKAAQMCSSFDAGMKAAEEAGAKARDEMVMDAE